MVACHAAHIMLARLFITAHECVDTHDSVECGALPCAAQATVARITVGSPRERGAGPCKAVAGPVIRRGSSSFRGVIRRTVPGCGWLI
eukprot:2112552-Prymnesium_polylepis.1